MSKVKWLSEATTNGEKTAKHILKISFDFAYYLICIPFHFTKVYNAESNQHFYRAKSWWPQKIVCTIFTFMDCLWMIYMIKTCFPTDPNNPAMFISMLGTFVSHIGKYVIIIKIWRGSENFKNIINYVTTQSAFLPKPMASLWNGRIGITVICGIYTCLGLINFSRVPGGEITFEFSMTRWWREIVEGGHKILFLDRNCLVTCTSNTSILVHSTFDVIVGVLSAAGLLHR